MKYMKGENNMKRIMVLAIVFVFLFTVPVVAGQKEELGFQLQALNEKATRMQVEFQLLQIQRADVAAKLKALQPKEQAKVKKPDNPEKAER